jgi:hypothetical protein
MDYPGWLWIPITVWAAFAQTLRNATQRGLTVQARHAGRDAGALPLWLAVRAAVVLDRPPVHRRVAAAPGSGFAAWVALGALSQIAATALLLRTMQERNFALGVAYSKTEVGPGRAVRLSSRWATG